MENSNVKSRIWKELAGSFQILLLLQEQQGQVSPNLSTEQFLLNETRSSGKVLGQIHQNEEAGSCALIEKGEKNSAGEKIQKGSQTTFDSSQVQYTSQWCVLQLSQRGSRFLDMQIEVENGLCGQNCQLALRQL